MNALWSKIFRVRTDRPQLSGRQLAKELDLPSSTVAYNLQKQQERNQYAESLFWESEAGQNFLKRLIVGVLYTFGIKGGIGAERIEEFFEQIRLYTHVGISPSSILRMIKEIEVSILRYKDLQEQDIQQSAAYKEELKLVLGLDETWLDKMLLVCQELSSGYLFLSKAQKNGMQTVGGKY